MGPLIDKDAVKMYLSAIEQCKAQGGNFVVEGAVLDGVGYESGCYVKPCIAEVTNSLPVVQHETFAPILYLIKYSTIEEAVAFAERGATGIVIGDNDVEYSRIGIIPFSCR